MLKDDSSKTLAINPKEQAKRDEEKWLVPQVILLSSGETSAVILELSAQDGEPQTLTFDDLGAITLSTDDKNEPPLQK